MTLRLSLLVVGVQRQLNLCDANSYFILRASSDIKCDNTASNCVSAPTANPQPILVAHELSENLEKSKLEYSIAKHLTCSQTRHFGKNNIM